MNKYFLICIITIFGLSSCKFSENNNLQYINERVEAVERVVSRYDNNVQSAIDSKNFDYIKLVSKTAIDSTDIKLNEVKSIEASSSLQSLQSAAVSYIGAMKEIILAEQAYSTLTDLTSIEDAKKMDEKLVKSSEKARAEYSKYISILNKLKQES